MLDMPMASLGLRTEGDTRSQVNSTTCVLTNPLISEGAPLIENHADNFLDPQYALRTSLQVA